MTRPTAIDVFVVDVVASRQLLEAEERQVPRLSAEDIARFQQKLSALGQDDACRWRAAHIALRIILERHAGLGLRGIAFDRASGGRPRIPLSLDLARAPEFSLSHADGVALIAISGHGAVGADIEVPRDIRMSAERRQRIVRAASRLATEDPLPQGSDAGLLQSWVRLEALAKATGLGIGRILTEAGVVGAPRTELDNAERSYPFSVTDLALGANRFGAVAASDLSPGIAVQAFPSDAASLAAFKMLGGQT